MIKLGKKVIGLGYPPIIVAELSANHNHSLDKALELVEAAAKAGADAVKLQTYTADTLTLDSANRDFRIDDRNSPWFGQTLYSLYKNSYTPWEWHKEIMQRANELGMLCFSTPFDESAVDYLEELDVPAYKIASFENTHLPLIEKVGATGKPIFISTGLATLSELSEAVGVIQGLGGGEIVLLKCTSSYPADPAFSNIRTLPDMRRRFNCEVGISDHTKGIGVAIASIGLGAVVIEKHFTLNVKEGGPDSSFSIEPHELKNLVTETKRAWEALGNITYGPTEDDLLSLKFRRSLYVCKNVKSGERITEHNVKIVRPGFGLSPKHYKSVIGKTFTKYLTKGTSLQWEHFE